MMYRPCLNRLARSLLAACLAALPALALAQARGQGGTEEGGYYGYHFRLLYAQGPAAPGGAYDYLVNGRMMGGFAVIAWLLRWVSTRSYLPFVIYRIALGLLLIILLLTGVLVA